MTLLTLHVGSGKCGSTAIQAALTRQPVIPLASGAATYVLVDRCGRVAAGDEVAPGPLGQAGKSAAMEDIAALAPDRLAGLRERLVRLARPVLSSERWLGTPDPAREVLGRLGLAVHVVVYVRPQADYVNAAFWQWDAWDGTTREQWLCRRLRRSRWHERAMRWRSIPEVERVTVRLMAGDVVADILGVLGATGRPLPARGRPNQGPPSALLRVLQDRPALRRKHAEALTWILPELLEGRDAEPPPWLLSSAEVERIQREQRPDNESLLDLLEPQEAARMRADRRWWEADAYAGRPAEPLRLPPSEGGDLDPRAEQLLRAAIRIAAERRGRARASA